MLLRKCQILPIFPFIISWVDFFSFPFCNASFCCREGKSANGMAIYFDNSLVVASAPKGKEMLFAKESEVCVILYALKGAK